MTSEKNDGFRPRRPANIDGFFAGPPGNRPRQPIFRASTPDLQPGQRTIGEMPDQSTLGVSQAPSQPPLALPGAEDRPRKRGHATPEPKKATHKTEHKRSWKRIAKKTGLSFGVLVLLLVGFLGFKFYRDIAKLTGNNNPFSLLSLFHPAHLKNQDGRINILVAGNSADDPGHGGADLTDSIMILSIDTRTNTAFMLSIPRDLWVNIPGDGYSKINAAYTHGGMDMLQRVIQSKLNVTIDYQVLVNYAAFRDLVNAVGGITINVKSSDPRGLYDPSIDLQTRRPLVKLSNGLHTLDGLQALDLARARGDGYGSYGYAQSDFTRTDSQRTMLLAIKDKATQASVIANPLKVTKLVDAVGGNVKTNLKINEIESLYYYSKKLNDGNIQSVNINTLAGAGTTLLANYTSNDGQAALIPAAGIDDFSDINAQLKKLFSNNPLTKEGADVVVLNGTNTFGLATKQRNILLDMGMNVESPSDAPATQATTTIIDNSNGLKPHTLSTLKSLYKATVVTNQNLTYAYPQADFIVILGQSAVPVTTTKQ